MVRIRGSSLPKKLRRQQTDAEGRLWYFLRNKYIEGFKFRRQHRLGQYIVDLVCLEKKLVIEVDGGQHNEVTNKTRDKHRTEWLKNEKYRVLRFWDNDVLTNTEGVLKVIRKELVT
jgi:very-short-patch-repair endonuclease